jgi:hypothetical protein
MDPQHFLKLWYAFFSGRSIKKVGNIGRIQARENSFDLKLGARKLQSRNTENNELSKTSPSKKYQRFFALRYL